jgi:hypothetical protein
MQVKQKETQNEILVCVDPGESVSGLVILRNGEIVLAENALHDRLFTVILSTNIQKSAHITVLVEDIRPYGLKLSPQIIETCKFLGELRYRLQTAKINVQWIPRNTVKKWVFDTFPEIVLPLVGKKIGKGLFKACNVTTKEEILVQFNGKRPRKESFIWVDDRMVIAAMKQMWDIETPKPGKTNRYGVKAHAWQALAVGSFYFRLRNIVEGRTSNQSV